MIRFINIGSQITDDNNEFAFYDTTTDTFCSFSGSQKWDSVENFKQDFDGNDIDRFLRLIHHNWNLRWKDVKLSLLGQEIEIMPVRYYTSDREQRQQIDVLKEQLKEALDSEDYLQANKIQELIKDLIR